ncbi:hypothetical protein [Phenylobacterium sp.]|uniref:hypothetical protein n=1 Tax=Phenylobacterium sp. TaxID=1871053 RepID=UPI002811AE53|nr:hypothetical protein [Phenylobacterium sp.]
MAGFSPSDAALEGFRLIRRRPGTLLAWSGIYFASVLVIGVAMMLSMGPRFIDMLKKGQLVSNDPEAFAVLLEQSWPAFLVVLLMTALLMSVIMGGIFRLVLGRDEKGLAHLRLGPDELRMSAVNLGLVGIGMAFLVFGLLVTRVAATQGGLLGFLVGLAVLFLTIWVGVRLCLVTPMTFDTGRVAFRSAWRLTRGRFWPLLGMIVLAVIFYVMVWIVAAVLAVIVVALAGGEQAIEDVGALSIVAGIAALVTIVMQALLQVLQIVMIYGPFAVAYRQITGEGGAEGAAAA